VLAEATVDGVTHRVLAVLSAEEGDLGCSGVVGSDFVEAVEGVFWRWGVVSQVCCCFFECQK
jgi:hypothetical protein